MMWFQRHEEPKTITDEFEQVRPLPSPPHPAASSAPSVIHTKHLLVTRGPGLNAPSSGSLPQPHSLGLSAPHGHAAQGLAAASLRVPSTHSASANGKLLLPEWPSPVPVMVGLLTERSGDSTWA